MLIFLFSGMFSFSILAQQPQTIKANLVAGDLVFCLQLLDKIEIRGEEVTAFLDVRSLLLKEVEKAQKENKKTTDPVTLEITTPVAQNFLTLMQRTKISGADAQQFKQITEAIQTAAAKALTEKK